MGDTQKGAILTYVVKVPLLLPAGQFCKITILQKASSFTVLLLRKVKMSGSEIKQLSTIMSNWEYFRFYTFTSTIRLTIQIHLNQHYCYSDINPTILITAWATSAIVLNNEYFYFWILNARPLLLME